METLYTLLEIVHYFVCFLLIVIVLLQTGKSGGMAGIFGGGGSDQLFNAPSGMAFIKKLTVVIACIFMFTSIALTKLSTKMSMKSVVDVPIAASSTQSEK